MPKFELYKHNDELFNIYHGIFYKLWTFAYFDLLCKLDKKGGWNKKKCFSSETTESISTKLCWNEPWVVPFENCVRQCCPVSKMAAMTKNRNFFKWPKLLYFKPESAKFELYKHNDELFNIYYGIFYELWTFAYFDRLCKLEKRGDEIKKKIFSETTVLISTKLCWNEPWVVPFENCVRQCCPVSKMAAMTKNRNFFKWPKLLYFKPESAKFELYKHNDELFNIYYGIFYELWTFAYFDQLCKLEKRGDEIKNKSSPLKLLSQSQPNFAEIILGWSPFKIVSVSAILYPKWLPLLKIEISSNCQNCSILSQKVPKFELYKHNDELFNIYYGIFYELWTFAYFGRLCKLEKRGDEIKKNLLL